MSKKYFELAVQLGLTTLLALGIASSSAQASSNSVGIRFEAELETPKITDVGNVTSTTTGETLVLHLKNGTLKITPLSQTDKTIQLRTVLYVLPDARPITGPASVSDTPVIDETTMKPIYNSTFLTNLNMDAELREMRQDGTLLYRLKLNPRTTVPLK